MFDVAIIGTGPAGISTALNMKIHNKDYIWFGSRKLSDKVDKAEQIRNYPGFIDVSGNELNEAFRKQVEAMDLQITEAMVNNIMPFGDHFAVTAGSEFYEAKTVVLTTGVAVKATIKNESEFLGRGVSYCATCDGNLYKGKTIAVVSNNARFEHEVKFLAELADKVHFFPQYPKAGSIAENVETHLERLSEINGEMKVNGISFGQDKHLDVDGVFVLRDSIALSNLLPGLEVDSNGHIIVDRQMNTSIKGVFAAGDCTGRPYQYTKAVGEGNVAAHSIIEYLAANPAE
ncbi:MAG: FAD-dependent oxidoreductase [Acetatifactor sp.]|nr:FAD-dependent oxidoreductase [Acetatifactor sp.]